MLARQLKLRLVADEGTDVPRSCTNIVVSIHAIATFQAFNDYLRPRILAASTLADRAAAGGAAAGGSLSNFLASFAAARAGEEGEEEEGGASRTARRRSSRLSGKGAEPDPADDEQLAPDAGEQDTCVSCLGLDVWAEPTC